MLKRSLAQSARAADRDLGAEHSFNKKQRKRKKETMSIVRASGGMSTLCTGSGKVHDAYRLIPLLYPMRALNRGQAGIAVN